MPVDTNDADEQRKAACTVVVPYPVYTGFLEKSVFLQPRPDPEIKECDADRLQHHRSVVGL